MSVQASSNYPVSTDKPLNPLRRYTKRCPSDGNRYRPGPPASSRGTMGAALSSKKSGGRSSRSRAITSSATSRGYTSSATSRGYTSSATSRESNSSRHSATSRRSATPDPENHTVLREVHYVDAINSAGVVRHAPFETRAHTANLLYLENSKRAAADTYLERGNVFPYEALPITKDQLSPLATGCAYSYNDVPKKRELLLGQTERSLDVSGMNGSDTMCVLEPYQNYFSLKNDAEGFEYEKGLRSVPPTPVPVPAVDSTTNYKAIGHLTTDPSFPSGQYH